MKAYFETRKHISDENYDKISKLRNEHGEVQFRMAISHLFSRGLEYFVKITAKQIEESYNAILEDEANKRSIMTPEFCRDLNYCALELSKLDHILLLKYITNYVFYDIK